LTGSEKMTEQLQVWDLSTLKLLHDVKWDVTDLINLKPLTKTPGAYVFGCQFTK
jgi:hypothetical protein